MENRQLIYKVYANYRKNQVFSFDRPGEIEKINLLIEKKILDTESFHYLNEKDTLLQICRDPFTGKGWEYVREM